MGFAHYWQFILNQAGHPVEGAVITLSAGSLPVTLFTAESINLAYSATSVSTDEKGFFEFWIPDKGESDTYGYNTSTLFDLTVSGSSLTPVTLTNIKMNFPAPRFYNTTLTDWSLTGGRYMCTVTHNLGCTYPLVTIYDTSGLDGSVYGTAVLNDFSLYDLAIENVVDDAFVVTTSASDLSGILKVSVIGTDS